ncbi:hypothetical protein AS9A_0064 [Hoyosella subflava DQS3-9A1]|uniref:Uncharacterized protein n=1 Tax=Hoyosella subflava (strain DSM 45089 / JCM 17490 / NBRC 109087 / DQS3-9A1) TaxID=443218 RepID=F6ERK4_HOYSD|nr:hypothetical protein AS9A_0064 [Hoyosella subflava DQS3-9A1]
MRECHVRDISVVTLSILAEPRCQDVCGGHDFALTFVMASR